MAYSASGRLRRWSRLTRCVTTMSRTIRVGTKLSGNPAMKSVGISPPSEFERRAVPMATAPGDGPRASGSWHLIQARFCHRCAAQEHCRTNAPGCVTTEQIDHLRAVGDFHLFR